MTRSFSMAVAAIALSLSSQPVRADEITTLGYESEEFQFTVLFGDAAAQDFVGAEWRLANFDKDRGRFERNKTWRAWRSSSSTPSTGTAS